MAKKLYLLRFCTTFFILLIFIPITMNNSEGHIYTTIEKVLQETIDTDYSNRSNQTEQHSSGFPTSIKYKHVDIQTETGIETIEFEDSLEINKVIQLTDQYMLTKSNPLKPHDFNAIFQEKLKEVHIEGKTGVIYHYENIVHSTEENFMTLENAITSKKTFIDAKKTAAVQVWVNCNLYTYLKHTSTIIYILFIISLIIGYFASIYLARWKQNRKNNQNDFIINTDKKEVLICGHTLRTTPMTFAVFQLLTEAPDTFVTRQQIENTLWEKSEGMEGLDNRINQTISTLRNDLKAFPEYQIINERGKGYKLIKSPMEDGKQET